MGSSVTPPSNPFIISAQTGSRKDSRARLTWLIGIITALLLGLMSIFLIYNSRSNPSRQIILLVVIQVSAWLIASIALLHPIKHTSIRVYLLISSILVMMLGYSILISGQAITSALAALAYTIVITSVSVSGISAERGLTLGGAGAWAISLVGLLSPYEKVPLPGIDILIPALLGILVVVYTTLLVMKYVTATLRLRMIIGSMLLVIIPLLAVSLIQATIVQNSVLERIKDTLLSASDQTAFRIDEFLDSNRNSITLDASLPALSNYLSLAPEKRPGSTEENNLKVTFDALKQRPQQYLISYGLLDYLGLVVFDTNPEEIGQYEANTESYSDALRGRQFISDIEFSENDGKPYLNFSCPVYDEDHVVRGIIRIRYDANILQSILSENTNIIGENTYPVLLDDNLMRLGDTQNPQHQYKLLSPLPETDKLVLQTLHRIPLKADLEVATHLEVLSNALTREPVQSFLTTSLNPETEADNDQEFIGVSHIKNKPWLVLYTQPASTLFDLTSAQQRTTTLVTAILAGLVALFTTVFAGALTHPISKLTETAQKITRGDLTVNADVTNDEIGTLANAFNIMTGRLRQFINELEERVRLRTSELAERNEALTIRSRQIQTIAEVARTIAATQDVESLLKQVTELVSDRFNFYHAGIFLIDENKEFAVLRASNSEGGKRMLARQHKLRIGQVGIVGHVCASGKARIATDVGSDAVFFNNPDLPLTRSEMALPLLGGGEIIGALDVQSTQPNAFTQEDIELFSTLADQAAIAILNNRAFIETQHALAEAQLIHRQYLEREWNRELSEKAHFAYEYTPQGLIVRENIVSDEIEKVFSTGEMVLRNSTEQLSSQKPAVLGMPIKLRGETIGIIHLQDESSGSREWANEEIQIVQTIADQVAQALENARLFQQTVRRADRERKVMEISSKIRSTTDPEQMMKIAVEELQHALHASKTQVILNQNLDKPEPDQTSLDEAHYPGGLNGNGKSGLG